MKYISFLILIVIFTSGFYFQQIPDEKKINELIEKLGDDDWKTRDAAEKELTKIGEPALKAVERVVGSKDVEVSTRAKRVVQEIKIVIGLKNLPQKHCDLWYKYTTFYGIGGGRTIGYRHIKLAEGRYREEDVFTLIDEVKVRITTVEQIKGVTMETITRSFCRKNKFLSPIYSELIIKGKNKEQGKIIAEFKDGKLSITSGEQKEEIAVPDDVVISNALPRIAMMLPVKGEPFEFSYFDLLGVHKVTRAVIRQGKEEEIDIDGTKVKAYKYEMKDGGRSDFWLDKEGKLIKVLIGVEEELVLVDEKTARKIFEKEK
jgi:hypothetical protein